jgi:hypothetical protein
LTKVVPYQGGACPTIVSYAWVIDRTKKMADEDKVSRPGQKQPEGERRFNQQQYDLLKRCSDKKDMTEWNKWRKDNPNEEIWLQGANLQKAHLENAYLAYAHLENADLRETNLENAFLGDVYMNNTCLWYAHLERAHLMYAHLENSNLWDAHLEHADLGYAFLENAKFEYAHMENSLLNGAHLENAKLWDTYMENAKLEYANLKNSHFSGTYLEHVELMEADLRGARFWNAKLQGADFSRAIFDGETLFHESCKIDENTKFEAVALGNLRIYPNIKQLLELNIRRMNWKVWYKEHWLLQWPVKLFWSFSNYGMSTWRIIGWFFLLALAFAAIYANCACWWPPGIVNNLEVEPHLPLWHYGLLVVLRPVYFSIVTMTTLGFGDMHANCQSFFGHLLLTVQVILGYVLLGALVTRFAVLFTAGGPAGKFTPTKTKEKAVDKKHHA